MQTCRRLLVGTGLLVALAAAGLASVWWLTAPTAACSKENALRLRRGMTVPQVRAILGSDGEPIMGAYEDLAGLLWPGGAGRPEIAVTLDSEARLDHLTIWSATEYRLIQPAPRSFDRVRRWLGS